MHAVFMLYGKKELVDNFLVDLMAQKFQLRCHQEGKEDIFWWIDSQVRIIPGGFDYIFPKEYQDLVLNSLRFNLKKPTDYAPFNVHKEFSIFGFKIKPIEYVRKFLNLEEIPEFKTEKVLIWRSEHVSIIPLGVKYDGEITEKDGWTHEAI